MEKVLKKMVLDFVIDTLKDVAYKEGIRRICVRRDTTDKFRGRLHWDRPHVMVHSCHGVDGEPEYYWIEVMCRNNGDIIFSTGDLGEGRAHIHFDENHADNSPMWFMAAILLGLFHQWPAIDEGEHPLGNLDYIIENYQTMKTFEDNPELKAKMRESIAANTPIKTIKKPKTTR